MYELKQARRITNNRLNLRLAKNVYFPTRLTLGLWKHKIRLVKFILVVDDFKVKNVEEEKSQYLINALRETNEIPIDKEGNLFCGVHLK